MASLAEEAGVDPRVPPALPVLLALGREGDGRDRDEEDDSGAAEGDPEPPSASEVMPPSTPSLDRASRAGLGLLAALPVAQEGHWER